MNAMEKASSLFREAGDAALGTQLPSHGAVLMRYHSAPSSVLASLLQSEDVLSNALPDMEDAELAEMCMLKAPANAHNAAMNTQAEYTTVHSPHMLDSLSSTLPQVPNASSSCPLQQCTDPDAAGQLRSIFRQRQITTVDNLQPSTQNARNHMGGTKSTYLGLAASVPPFIQPFVSAEGNLIRQSSFPAEILSRLGIEDGNEASIQGFAGNLTCHANMMAFSTAAESVPLDDGRLTGMEVDIGNDNMRTAHLRPNGTWDAHIPHCNGGNTRFPVKNTGLFESTEPGFMKGSSFNCKSSSDHVNGETMVGVCKNRSMESRLSINQSSLFRQSSLPASLLSQLSFDGASEKVSMTSSSGNSSEDGGPHFTSQVSGLWDEAGGLFGQRKRVRKVEDKAANKFCTLDSIQGLSVENELLHWKIGGQVGASSSGHLLSTDDSVLCKVRAKRGCATHPRSIAERVRRTKISEAMRKLQELVPNMEKQTNTATMLEEAVNYVKFLKQQVQKLSENQSKCRGTCDARNNR